ncbi:hypothetical protein TNCV_2035181 [Trichonephila clavipes]|nr:hypothetical protein TNCV_2035181 [Trichonephila clavipes]
MPRASTKVFRKGVFNGYRCNKSNDGSCMFDAILLFSKNSADKNCADGAKLCTNETEPSASERKNLNMDISYSDEAFSGFMQQENFVNTVWKAVRNSVDENDGKRDLAVAVDPF